jgi:hypothetical protein
MHRQQSLSCCNASGIGDPKACAACWMEALAGSLELAKEERWICLGHSASYGTIR